VYIGPPFRLTATFSVIHRILPVNSTGSFPSTAPGKLRRDARKPVSHLRLHDEDGAGGTLRYIARAAGEDFMNKAVRLNGGVAASAE
jgi:hypothetical protein